MPEAHKKAEEKFKIGEYAVTNFKLDEHDNLRCKAGPLNICVDRMKRIAVGGTTKGKGEEMVHWIAEGYSKKSFLFFTGEPDQISKKNFKPGDFLEISLACNVTIEKDDLYLEIVTPKVEPIKLVAAGTEVNKFKMGAVKEILEQHKKGELRLVLEKDLSDSTLKAFEKIADCEEAIKLAASSAGGIVKLREHPQIDVYRLYLKKIRDSKMGKPFPF